MDITRIDDGALEVLEDGKKLLGFPTDIPPRRFSSADTVSMRNSEGVVVGADGRIESWPMIRFVEHEGVIAGLGPWPGDSEPFDPKVSDPSAIAALIPALRALKARDFPLNGLFVPALRRLSGGGWLVFPPLLASFAAELHPADRIHEDLEAWTHPDLKGEEAWSFSLGMLAWRSLTGEDPYSDETGESRRERIRKGNVPPLEATVPAVDPKASVFLSSALTGGGNGRPALDDWERFLERWIDRGILQDVTEEEAEIRRNKAIRKAESTNRNLSRTRWFRKSGWKLFTAVAAAVAVIAVGTAPLKKALEDPVTVGMTPMEVARTYYGAIDALDSETMNDCLAKNVGKEDLRRVDMVFVTHKVRQGYERLGDLPRASEWLEAGRPPLEQGVAPWGITDLGLTDLGDGRIEAEYRFWVPSGDGSSLPEGLPYKDILEFTEARRSWEISEITRILPE
jgi:hypothetical protein